MNWICTNSMAGYSVKIWSNTSALSWNEKPTCLINPSSFYLMHCQNKDLFKKYKECRAYEEAFKLKEEGLIRHVGF